MAPAKKKRSRRASVAKTPPDERRDRFQACLLAGALGDALGVPLDAGTPWQAIAERCGATTPEELIKAKPAPPARVSDDTLSVLFVAEGLIRSNQRLAARGISDAASSTYRALARWKASRAGHASEGWHTPGWLMQDPQVNQQTQTASEVCGWVIRAAPIGLVCRNEEAAFELASDSATALDSPPDDCLSVACFAAIISCVSRGQPLPRAIKRAVELVSQKPESAHVLAVLEKSVAATAPSPEAIAALDPESAPRVTLGTALACALTAGRATPAVTSAVLWRAALSGGARAAAGSLTGHLLGAMHGKRCLPRAWLAQLELRDVITRIARDLHRSCVLGKELDFKDYPGN